MSRRQAKKPPLHEKIYLDLVTKIESGELAIGAQLPSELELSVTYAVSRGTTRHAINRLTAEGRVERAAGRGTFVSSRRLTYPAQGLLGFSNQILASGRKPSSSLVDISVVDASSLADEFSFGGHVERLISVRRVRLADDDPVALEQLLLPWPRFAGLRDLDLEHTAVYDVLEDQFGVKLGAGDFQLEIENLDDQQARLLRQEPGTASFLMRGLVRDQEENPIVAVRCYYHRSWYAFQLSLPRETQTPPVRPVMTQGTISLGSTASPSDEKAHATTHQSRLPR